MAATIAVAMGTGARREMTGLGTGPSEAETFSTECLRGLKARGMDGIGLAISDARTGLKAAISAYSTPPGRAAAHRMRNALTHARRGST